MDLTEICPKSFDFFHYGKVSVSPEHVNKTEPFLSISFQTGSKQIPMCLVCFHELPEIPDCDAFEMESMAVEIANILATKFMNELSRQSDEFISISPPQILNKNDPRDSLIYTMIVNQLSGTTVESSSGAFLKRDYTFFDGEKNASMTLLCFERQDAHA